MAEVLLPIIDCLRHINEGIHLPVMNSQILVFDEIVSLCDKIASYCRQEPQPTDKS